eukprot:1159320-Pelagomonas_calceolata.AAC.12
MAARLVLICGCINLLVELQPRHLFSPVYALTCIVHRKVSAHALSETFFCQQSRQWHHAFSATHAHLQCFTCQPCDLTCDVPGQVRAVHLGTMASAVLCAFAYLYMGASWCARRQQSFDVSQAIASHSHSAA